MVWGGVECVWDMGRVEKEWVGKKEDVARGSGGGTGVSLCAPSECVHRQIVYNI